MAAVAGLAALLAFQLATAPAVLRERGVHLVPLGDFDAEVLRELADHYERRYGLHVEILDGVALEDRAIDEHRGQYVAEDLVRLVWERYRIAPESGDAVVIAVTDEDMYMRGYAEWNFVFSYRWDDGGYAVVSTARMTNSDELTLSRLRKMVTKSVGVMYYGLSVSDDPASVLYTPLSVDDLDRMGEDLLSLSADIDSGI